MNACNSTRSIHKLIPRSTFKCEPHHSILCKYIHYKKRYYGCVSFLEFLHHLRDHRSAYVCNGVEKCTSTLHKASSLDQNQCFSTHPQSVLHISHSQSMFHCPTPSTVLPPPLSYSLHCPTPSTVLPPPLPYPLHCPTPSTALPPPLSYPLHCPTRSTVLPPPLPYPIHCPTHPILLHSRLS